ncbi:LutC/YkgG family protein [Streptomyces sp. NPDC002520]
MSSSRERVLARIRTTSADVPTESADIPVRRDYRAAHIPEDPATMLTVLAENLADYRAIVHHAAPKELPDLIDRLLAERGARSLAVPADLPPEWLAAVSGVRVLTDGPALTASRLDSVDSTLTGCALAVAETGTIVLDAGVTQGRRALTLVPDHHICVVRADQIVASVPRALRRLDAVRPQTWISGPSATSDIELDRVEGVHGPRRLEVVLVSDRPG